MSSAHVARKVLGKAIPPADKEKAEQFSLEDLVTKSFHTLGQVIRISLGNLLVININTDLLTFGRLSCSSLISLFAVKSTRMTSTSKLPKRTPLSSNW